MARAEAAKIEAEAAVQAANLKAEALKIETESELERLKGAREADDDIKFTSWGLRRLREWPGLRQTSVTKWSEPWGKEGHHGYGQCYSGPPGQDAPVSGHIFEPDNIWQDSQQSSKHCLRIACTRTSCSCLRITYSMLIGTS